MGILERWSLKPKMLYFFVNLQYFTIHQFKQKFFLTQFGIEEDQYARVAGTVTGLSVLSNIYIGYINDETGRVKDLLLSALFLCFACFCMFYIGVVRNTKWLAIIVFSVYTALGSATIPTLDRVVMDYLSVKSSTKAYSRQRLFGSLGFLACFFIVETLIIETNIEGSLAYDFKWLPYYVGITTALSAFLVYLFVKNIGRSKGSQKRLLINFWGLIGNLKFVFFLFFILLNGITRASMTLYLSQYLRDVCRIKDSFRETFGADVKQISTINTVFSVAVEVVTLLFYKNVSSRFGYYTPLLFAQIFQLLRFIGYLSVDSGNKHIFLYSTLFEMMKGLNFGLTHASAVQIVSDSCPVEVKNTAQMLYNSFFVGIGSILAGFLFANTFSDSNYSIKDKYAKVFRWNLYITIFSIVIFVFRYGFIDRRLKFR